MRAKLATFGLVEADAADAVRWARSAGAGIAAPKAAEPAAARGARHQRRALGAVVRRRAGGARAVGLVVRALGCPKFRLSSAEHEELLADLMPWVEVVRISNPPPAAPACRDPFDLPFVHLAIAGKARVLVSGDRDLLALAGAPGLCPVLSVEAFCRQFLGD